MRPTSTEADSGSLLTDAIRAASLASGDLVRALEVWALEQRDRIASMPKEDQVGAADAAFEKLWEVLIEIGEHKNPTPNGMLSLAQGVEVLTHKIGIDKGWTPLHKGAHFYNMGLMYYAMCEVDRAFKFFLMADEEDVAHKGSAPGALFRNKRIFVALRTRFFSHWLEKTRTLFHDGLGSVDDRVALLAASVSVLPERYLLARCQLGIMRACMVSLLSSDGVYPPFVEYLMCAEDLALLTEAVARMFHEGVWQYTTVEMLGSMLSSPKAALRSIGFYLSTPKIEISDQSGFSATLTKASAGDRQAIATVVKAIRNQSSHATPFPAWCLDPLVLKQIVFVQLDFIVTVLAELTKRASPPVVAPASSVGPTTGPSSALASPSGSSP